VRVGLIGPYPPPKGGISVHIKRLEENLSEMGVEVTIFHSAQPENNGGRVSKKLSKLRWLFQFMICPRVDIFHLHHNRWRECAFIIIVGKLRRIKTVMTVHSLRDDLEQKFIPRSLSISLAMRHADYLIAVGENERNKLLKHFDCEARLAVLPAFIPPKSLEIKLPEHITEFIRNHEFIISANGSNMNFYQGLDIYGLDMLVELCGRLSGEIRVGFIYCLTRITDKLYFKRITDRIKELRLETDFLWVTDSMELRPILEKTHLFVRPSCTDSYGVSIAEAIMLGIPCVVSNVCKRPEGAILFQTRNSEDFYSKVRAVITNYDQCKKNLQDIQIEDCTPAIQKIYQSLVL